MSSKQTENIVVFAEDAVTVHRIIGDPVTKEGGKTHYPIQSVNLMAGDTIEFNLLPPYLQDAILEGTTYALKALTPEEVKARLAERDRILAVASKEELTPDNVLTIA